MLPEASKSPLDKVRPLLAVTAPHGALPRKKPKEKSGLFGLGWVACFFGSLGWLVHWVTQSPGRKTMVELQMQQYDLMASPQCTPNPRTNLGASPASTLAHRAAVIRPVGQSPHGGRVGQEDVSATAAKRRLAFFWDGVRRSHGRSTLAVRPTLGQQCAEIC